MLRGDEPRLWLWSRIAAGLTDLAVWAYYSLRRRGLLTSRIFPLSSHLEPEPMDSPLPSPDNANGPAGHRARYWQRQTFVCPHGPELQQYPYLRVDLNLGCPAAGGHRKCAGAVCCGEPKAGRWARPWARFASQSRSVYLNAQNCSIRLLTHRKFFR